MVVCVFIYFGFTFTQHAFLSNIKYLFSGRKRAWLVNSS